MACTEEKPIFKHYCRICKKGFMCGRALGGHMRAHGFGDEGGNVDEDDQVSDWEDYNNNKKNDHNRSSSSSSRRMYQLRTNPNRLKSCRVCENCGKEFLSWKSFLEHGKCNSEDAESLVSSPGSDDEYGGGDDGDGGGGGRRRSCGQWSKRKRSVRTKVGGSFNSSSANNNLSSELDDDLLLAKCLVELANNARFEDDDDDDYYYYDQPEESCASASREDERPRNPAAATTTTSTSTFLAPSPSNAPLPNNYNKSGSAASKGLFECKACKKVFNSHQALGGHRASHKKVKGCYAAKQDQQNQVNVDVVVVDGGGGGADEDVITHDQDFFPSKSSASSFEQGSSKWTRRKSKVHECTICHRIFSTGQALGGHKRCHWMTSNTHHHDPIKNIQLHDDQVDQKMHHHHHHHTSPPPPLPAPHNNSNNIDKTEGLDLNLNLPAAQQEIEIKSDPKNPLNFEVYSGIHLQMWPDNNNNNNNNAETEAKDNININVDVDHDLHHHHHHHQRRTGNKGGDHDVNPTETKVTVEEEADSKVKLEKLSELKGISMSGSSSPWLQVGIGNSTTDVAAGP